MSTPTQKPNNTNSPTLMTSLPEGFKPVAHKDVPKDRFTTGLGIPNAKYYHDGKGNYIASVPAHSDPMLRYVYQMQHGRANPFNQSNQYLYIPLRHNSNQPPGPAWTTPSASSDNYRPVHYKTDSKGNITGQRLGKSRAQEREIEQRRQQVNEGLSALKYLRPGDLWTGAKALTYTVGKDLNTLGYDADIGASTLLLHFLRGVGAKEDTLTAIKEHIRDNYRQKGYNHKVYTDAQNNLEMEGGYSPYIPMSGAPGYTLQDTLKWGVYSPYGYLGLKYALKGGAHIAKAPLRILGRAPNMVKAVQGMRTTPFNSTYQLVKNLLGTGADALAVANSYGAIPTYVFPNTTRLYSRLNGGSGQLPPYLKAMNTYGRDMIEDYPWLFPVQHRALKGYTTPIELMIKNGPNSFISFEDNHGNINAMNQALYNMAWPARTLTGFNPDYDMNAMGYIIYDILSNHPNETVKNIVTGLGGKLESMQKEFIDKAKREGKSDEQIQRELMVMEQNYYNSIIPYISDALYSSMQDPANKEYVNSIPLDIARFNRNELMNVLHYTMPYAMRQMIPDSTFNNLRGAAVDYRNNLINGGRQQ